MSMNSNIMGMQGPNLNNPCASPQVPPMHSEAKMVKREFFEITVFSHIAVAYQLPRQWRGERCSQILLTSFLVIRYTLFLICCSKLPLCL